MLTAVVGINWGDEGKGRMVDLLADKYDIICRYQGGNNAGHTVVNERGEFILNLLPSGILRDNKANVMGNGMVIDIEHLCKEIGQLREKGIYVSPGNLKVSDKAFICMPYHKRQDILEEDRLRDRKYGSTRRGIAPVYGDKYMKKGLRIGDLLNAESLAQKVDNIVEWKNITFRGYDTEEVGTAQVMEWLHEYGEVVRPYITDVTKFLSSSINVGKKVLFEAQLGALRDIDYGIYPYTTSSQTLASYATTGAGIPGERLDDVVGIMKAYSSCVGEGPFAVEMSGDEAHALREAGAEYGAATGRPRRVGGFDVLASKYGIRVQGADAIALTKLDVLSYLDEIPVCVAYEVDGEEIDYFPSGDVLVKARPIFQYLEGFKADISKCRKKEDLPDAARRYIEFLEDAVECPIRYVSVGASREDYLTL